MDVIVDATDFLFTLFQLGDADRARRLFGARIRRYLDRAYKIEDGLARIPICHLAVQDDAIVSAHAENRIVIGGRMRTAKDPMIAVISGRDREAAGYAAPCHLDRLERGSRAAADIVVDAGGARLIAAVTPTSWHLHLPSAPNLSFIRGIPAEAMKRDHLVFPCRPSRKIAT